MGGGIYNAVGAGLAVVDSVFQDCFAFGGTDGGGGGGAGQGGAIFEAGGTVTVVGSTFHSDVAQGSYSFVGFQTGVSAGGALYVAGGTLDVSNSFLGNVGGDFIGNSAGSFGTASLRHRQPGQPAGPGRGHLPGRRHRHH
jgi:hypothetical protein